MPDPKVFIVQAFRGGEMTHCDVISEAGGVQQVEEAVKLIGQDLFEGERAQEDSAAVFRSMYRAEATVCCLRAAVRAQPAPSVPDHSRMLKAKVGPYTIFVVEREVHSTAAPL